LWMSRCPRIHRCSILKLKIAAACFTTLPAPDALLDSTDPEKGMAGRCIQGLLDVLEGNYGGDVTRMPYVVNKEAWTNLGVIR